MSWSAVIRKRFFGLTERWFPIWTLRRGLKAFMDDPDLRKARAERNWAAIKKIEEDLRLEAEEYSDAIEELETRRLLRKVSRLHLRMDDVIQDQDNWRIGPWGNRYLVGRAFDEAYRRVRAAQRENLQFWRKFVSPLIAALTGLVGALAALVALLLRK